MGTASRFLLGLYAVAAWSGGLVHAATAEGGGPDEAAAIAFSQDSIGTQVRDYRFTGRDGRNIRLSDFRGKPLVVNFIYTGCVQACPTTVRFLMKAVDAARKTLGGDRFAVATVGFNLPFDTSQAMNSFALKHGINDSGWHFLSPDATEIGPFTKELGFTYYPTPKGFDHIAQVTVIDAEGRIYRQIYGESFDVPMLVEPLKQLITGTPTPAGDWRGFLEKVRLFCTVYDRSSGRYRLDYSLFLGMFIGLTIVGLTTGSLVREWRRSRRS
ncbi:MAG: SCO family protein [Burkholderiales bacterium]